ncbi:5-formyltetrahydrofolate cyclo-ligase [Thermoproteota archaeon]
METIKIRKLNLRKEMLEKRRGLVPGFIKDASQSICAKLTKLDKIKQAKYIAGYAAFDNEANINACLNQCIKENKHVVLPCFENNTYTFCQISDWNKDLIKGKYGILEPKNKKNTLSIQQMSKLVDVWLVPGVAFDKNGRRLGRGMAIYDQILMQARGYKIGIAYEFQIVPTTLLPNEPHDQGMDIVITEKTS